MRLADLWETGSFHRDRGSCYHPKTDRLTVEEFTIITGALDGMTDGVTEIEDSTFARSIKRVFCNNRGLDLDVAPNERRKIFPIDVLQRAEHSRISDDCVLDYLGEAFANSRGGRVFKTSRSSITSAE